MGKRRKERKKSRDVEVGRAQDGRKERVSSEGMEADAK